MSNRFLARPGALVALATAAALTLFPAAARTAQSEQVLYSFTGGTDGGAPNGTLIFNASGVAFGTTTVGGIGTCGHNGSGGCGVVFALTPTKSGPWAETPLYAFTDAADGAFPNSGLIFDRAGNVYGTASGGGSKHCAIGCGVVFELLKGKNWSESVLHAFTGSDGSYPYAYLLAGAGGVLYSTTWYGGANGHGTVFSLTPGSGGRWTENDLYDFQGKADGSGPAAGVVQNRAGDLFGTTYNHDGFNYGVAYELVPQPHGPWKESILADFNGKGGSGSYAPLIGDSAGNLYGTAILGGKNLSGVVYQLVRNGNGWKKNVPHAFGAAGDGKFPYGGLITDKAGTIFGTTVGGGASSLGTVFKLTHTGGSNWTESILYEFSGGADGANPVGALTLDTAGNLYGATNGGGAAGSGVIFKITP